MLYLAIQQFISLKNLRLRTDCVEEKVYAKTKALHCLPSYKKIQTGELVRTACRVMSVGVNTSGLSPMACK